VVVFEELTFCDENAVSSLTFSRPMTHALLFNRSCTRLREPESPTLGIWSTNDHYLDGEGMKMSGRFVKGPWRYEQFDGASHWIPLDASDRLNQPLIAWLG
jgi:pimeloyl-ACP methyl ester carboxylesterase